jgi:hypothetical protein
MTFILTLLVCALVLIVFGCMLIFRNQNNMDMLISDKNTTIKTANPSAPRYDYVIEI